MSSRLVLARVMAPLNRGLLLGMLLGVLSAMPVGASEPIYQPVNRNFGGNPLNDTFLFQQATNNNRFLTAPSTSNQLNSTQSFNSQVRDALLSALESQAAQIAVNAILGTNGQAVNQGTVNIGGELIQFQRSADQRELDRHNLRRKYADLGSRPAVLVQGNDERALKALRIGGRIVFARGLLVSGSDVLDTAIPDP